MKKALLIFCLIFTGSAHAQIKSDTTPVWVIYLDSVRIFAAAPEYDMRVEATAGWRVRKYQSAGKDIRFVDFFYDQNGVLFPEEIVIQAKPRWITPNPFRQ